MSNSEYSVYESATEPVMVVGRDGVIVFANGPAEDLLDYSPGTLAGLSVEALVPESYRKRHVDLRKMFHSDSSMRFDVIPSSPRRITKLAACEMSASPLCLISRA